MAALINIRFLKYLPHPIDRPCPTLSASIRAPPPLAERSSKARYSICIFKLESLYTHTCTATYTATEESVLCHHHRHSPSPLPPPPPPASSSRLLNPLSSSSSSYFSPASSSPGFPLSFFSPRARHPHTLNEPGAWIRVITRTCARVCVLASGAHSAGGHTIHRNFKEIEGHSMHTIGM